MQKTEIEEPSDSGSNSNPSDDNLSESEILSKVYLLSPDKIQAYNDKPLTQMTPTMSSSQFFNKIKIPTTARKDSELT